MLGGAEYSVMCWNYRAYLLTCLTCLACRYGWLGLTNDSGLV